MGLDMYLYRTKRIDGATPKEFNMVNNYLTYMEDKKLGKTKKHDSDEDYTPMEWCGCDLSKVDMELVDKYKSEFFTRYSLWDTEHKYGYSSISQQVGYWRKANQIHNWFVENVQNGEDDCGEYEVTKRQLKELLDICEKVKGASHLIEGKVQNGYTFENGERKYNYEDGKYIEDSSVAEKLLPTTSGFFFGGTEYDQWYYRDIIDTIEMLNKVLMETDFEKEVVTYSSSW